MIHTAKRRPLYIRYVQYYQGDDYSEIECREFVGSEKWNGFGVYPTIETRGGVLVVRHGDYIVRGLFNDINVIPPELFLTYHEVTCEEPALPYRSLNLGGDLDEEQFTNASLKGPSGGDEDGNFNSWGDFLTTLSDVQG